jgi:hypothetical protein
MVEAQICEFHAQFSALLTNGLGFEVKACILPKAVHLY